MKTLPEDLRRQVIDALMDVQSESVLWDWEAVSHMLLHGCLGYNNMSDEELVQELDDHLEYTEEPSELLTLCKKEFGAQEMVEGK